MVDRQTPLSGQSLSIDGLTLEELPASTKVNLRGDSTQIRQAIEAAAGLSVTDDANTVSDSGQHSAYWLGPDEFLLYAGDTVVSELIGSLTQHLPSGKAAVVDVSDYYTVIRLSGEKSRAVLASGTPFDVHADLFGVGHCAQTRYGNASVLLSRVAEHSYDVQVRWSFARYLWQYMARVGQYV